MSAQAVPDGWDAPFQALTDHVTDTLMHDQEAAEARIARHDRAFELEADAVRDALPEAVPEKVLGHLLAASDGWVPPRELQACPVLTLGGEA